MQKLLSAVQLGESLFDQVSKENARGYVVLKDKLPEGVIAYEEAAPTQYAQFAGRTVKEFPTFNEAVDTFFSQVESQKADVQRTTAENAAKKKLDKFREEHSKRISAMHEAELTNERRARLIEANLTEVEQCLAIVRSALGTGMDWTELARIVKEEKKRNSGSVANIIHRLVLDKNMITLLLSDPLDDDDDYEEDESDEDNEEVSQRAPKVSRAPELVDVDIGLSGYANARKYYEIKKQTVQKAQKTIDMTEQALKAAERKSQKAMKEANAKQAIMMARKPFWFEKFYWFITSENYIIVCGRDMHQNEMLYKRYLEKDDLYVHADIHGASTCIIKNPSGGPVPPQTLSQAGVMCVCLSNAWQAKIVTSAWWVYANQVSKTAPTGEYLTTGSFMIRGKKNFLPPAQLVLGFGFMFKLDESSVAAHLGERSKAQLNEVIESAPTTPSSAADTPAVQPVADTSSAKADEEEGSDEELDKLEKRGVDFTKYKLNLIDTEEQNEDEPDDGDDTASTASSVGDGKKRLTASDRRKLKRGKDLTAPTQPKPKPPPKPEAPPKVKEPPPTAPQKGGKKKGKLQELDEDEKAARALLLGLGGKPKENKGKGKGKNKGKEKDNKTSTNGAKNNTTKAVKPPVDNKKDASTTENPTEEGSAPSSSDKVCFKCGVAGHIVCYTYTTSRNTATRSTSHRHHYLIYSRILFTELPMSTERVC